MKYTTKGLALAGMDLIPPFSVTMRADPSGDIYDQSLVDLEYVSVGRALAGRRLSGLARLDDRLVFAKLFYGKDARRYWQRELNGAQRLSAANVASPAVIGGGATEEGDGLFVLYEGIRDAEPLQADRIEHIDAAVNLTAQMHDAGLIQGDIHLNNFIVANGEYYVIDADAIRRAPLLRQQFANLALLLAQRAPVHDQEVFRYWTRYAGIRGEYVQRMGSAEAMRNLVLKQRAVRVRRYLKKTERACTEFVHKSSFRHDWLCARQHAQRLQRFMVFPEEVFGEGTPLKLGRSATVVRIVVDGREYVVKRYNIKNFAHRLRRWFRQRGRNAWRNGHWMKFLSIRVAAPVALLERKFGWFKGVSYLVMEDAGDHHLGALLSTSLDDFDAIAAQTVEIMRGVKAAGLRHGDFKATNFVLDRSTDKLTLIDYDAVTMGSFDDDRHRFLRNWEESSELRVRWERCLEAAGI